MIPRDGHRPRRWLLQCGTFPVRLDAGHTARSVAQTLLLLTLAVLIGRTFAQTFLALL